MPQADDVQGGHGRRVRRAAPTVARRSRVGPMTGWAGFTLVMTAAVLLVLGFAVVTVAWVLVAGLLVAGALLLSARLSPLAPAAPGEPVEADEPRPVEPDRRRPPAP